MNFRQWCITKAIQNIRTSGESDPLPKAILNGTPENSLALRFQRNYSRFCSVSTTITSTSTTSAPHLDSWNILESIRAYSRSFCDKMFKFMGKLSLHFADWWWRRTCSAQTPAKASHCRLWRSRGSPLCMLVEQDGIWTATKFGLDRTSSSWDIADVRMRKSCGGGEPKLKMRRTPSTLPHSTNYTTHCVTAGRCDFSCKSGNVTSKYLPSFNPIAFRLFEILQKVGYFLNRVLYVLTDSE